MKDSKKIFSIIVPAHNEEKTILRLLETLRNQNFQVKEMEIIAVDNNSTDQTAKTVTIYKSKHPEIEIILTKEKKTGVSFARNKGGKLAKGKYLIFLDADNIIPKNFLDNIYKIIVSKKFEAGTFLTLPDEKSVPGYLIFLTLALIKISLNQPFGKSFCAKTIFKKVGGYNTHVNLGTNLDFLTRVNRYLQGKNQKVANTIIPVYTSLRRFKKYGWLPVLCQWLMAYLGVSYQLSKTN